MRATNRAKESAAGTRRSILLIAAAASAACAATPVDVTPDEAAATDTALVALTDLDTGSYRGFPGGLYTGGANQPPAEHAAEGAARAARIEPRARDGSSSPDGRIVLLSIGMSNTSQEFCAQAGYTACDPWTFMGQAAADPTVNHSTLVIVNGARGGQSAETWDAPEDPNYDRVRDQGLAPLGLTEDQVQIAWVKQANPRPTLSLPASEADAYALLASLGRIARALRQRYPNLQQVFVSSRIYAGFATTTLNPEPYAYESGFAVKWLIEAQIEQARQPAVQQGPAGDVNYRTAAPWLAWGPYLWADDAASPRSDGLFWVREDFQSDGTHPARSGEEKVGRLLLEFFKTSPFTRCWFLAGQTCQ